MESLNEKDIPRFLDEGNLTKPFLKNEYVLDMVLRDYKAKLKSGKEANILSSLYNWVFAKTAYTSDRQFQGKWKFRRSAEEIWASKTCTGCTDYALLFATFARQIGVPTTILHTASRSWVKALQQNEDFKEYVGHTFCECYHQGRWLLVDPTARRIQYNYTPEKVRLDYEVGGEKVFIPYARDIDLDGVLGQEAHNLEMEEKCKNIPIDKNKDIQIVEACESDYEQIKDLLVELQNYIASIDKYKLNILTDGYREGYFNKTLSETNSGGGKIFVAKDGDKVIGVIAGHLRKYNHLDRLDFTCPKMGIIEELIVSQNARAGGVGKMLVEKMEEFFKLQDCEFVKLEVFAYNKNAHEFYLNLNYENRLIDMIKKL